MILVSISMIYLRILKSNYLVTILLVDRLHSEVYPDV